jgi:hypothetical protein
MAEAGQLDEPVPRRQPGCDIEAAPRRRSFHDRIAEKLADDPAWN